MNNKLLFLIIVVLLSGKHGNIFAQTMEYKPKVYVVANAHLDTQWNWDVQTTIKEYVRNTLNQIYYC